jgi:hypothetical protein
MAALRAASDRMPDSAAAERRKLRDHFTRTALTESEPVGRTKFAVRLSGGAPAGPDRCEDLGRD